MDEHIFQHKDMRIAVRASGATTGRPSQWFSDAALCQEILRLAANDREHDIFVGELIGALGLGAGEPWTRPRILEEVKAAVEQRSALAAAFSCVQDQRNTALDAEEALRTALQEAEAGLLMLAPACACSGGFICTRCKAPASVQKALLKGE